MKAIVIEDEKLAAEELCNRIREVAPQIEIVAKAASVAEAVHIIPRTAHDLIFMDINLGDGSSFDIFSQIDISAPVIFITAYDEYALKAFKHQGVGYILKPFENEELIQAIAKLDLLKSDNNTPSSKREDIPNPVETAANSTNNHTTSYQNRFLVYYGQRMRSITTAEIAFFVADGKYVMLWTHDGNSYLIDQTITSLTSRLSPDLFYRINRKFIVSYQAIGEMVRYSNNRIKISLKPTVPEGEDAIVSADRVQGFRAWLNK